MALSDLIRRYMRYQEHQAFLREAQRVAGVLVNTYGVEKVMVDAAPNSVTIFVAGEDKRWVITPEKVRARKDLLKGIDKSSQNPYTLPIKPPHGENNP